MKEILPTGWIQIPFISVFDINGGTQPPKKEFIYQPQKGYIRLLQIRDFGEKPVPTYIPDDKNLRTCKENDILIARYGASIGRIVTGMEGAYNVALAKVVIPDPVNMRYVYWLLNSYIFQNPITSFQRTAQNGFNKNDLKEITIPIAPLPEQTRIVAKLDALFAHLDTLKTKLDRIPELLKNFRQQVLTQAVTGKLTEEWRKGKGLVKWENLTIGDLFDVKTGATPFRGNADYYLNAKIPWIKSGQVNNQIISEADEFITQKAVDETNAKIFPANTLLVAMYGEGKTRGQVGWLKIEAATNQAIAALVNTEISVTTRKYVFYFCLSQYNEIRAKAEGGNQPNLNLSKIKNWEISLPPIFEQEEIIKTVDKLFQVSDTIEAHYKTLKEKIDTLPQAILTKAFKGKLIPQDSNDEPAGVLLKRIMKEKEKL